MRTEIQNHLELPRNDARYFSALARDLVQQAQAKGETLHLVQLGIGEPDFRTPEHIRNAALVSLQEEPITYGPPAGWPWLRDLLAQKVAQANGYTVDPENIAISMGATGAIIAVMTALLDPGDEVLVPSPGWPQYRMQLACCGGKPVGYTLHPPTWLPDIDELEKLVTPRTRLLIINSPSNPTGAVFPEAVVRELVDFARRHDLYLLSDECYNEIVFDGKHTSPASLLTRDEFESDKLICVYSFSKTYAMTGWRIGYVVTNKQLLVPILHVLDSTHTNISTIIQRAAAIALTGPQDCVEVMRDSYRRRRDLVIDALKEYGLTVHPPEGAFYLMLPVTGNGDERWTSTQFTHDLLMQRHVVVAPGDSYGDVSKNYVRLSLAASEQDLIQGVKEICTMPQ